MHVVLIARDRPDSLELRLATRQAHLDYLEEKVGVVVAGPLLGDDGKPKGSLIILDVADFAAAEDWAANDPYAVAGLFESVELSPWTKVVWPS